MYGFVFGLIVLAVAVFSIPLYKRFQKGDEMAELVERKADYQAQLKKMKKTGASLDSIKIIEKGIEATEEEMRYLRGAKDGVSAGYLDSARETVHAIRSGIERLTGI